MFANSVPEAQIGNYHECRVRCMEHALNLAAGHFTQAVTSTGTSTGSSWVDQEEDDSNEDVDVSDALGKALALITQIWKSPQARTFFCQSCAETNVPELELVQWVRTRWASLFTCLDRLLLLQKGVNRFVRLADDSDNVPNLRNRQYADFTLTQGDWLQLSLLHEALHEPADATQSFSSSKHPTIWRAIPVLEFMQENWKNMAADDKFSSMTGAFEAGLKNLNKWTQKTDDTDVYFICLALNPSYKLEYARSQWNTDAFNKGSNKLEAAFDRYYAPVPTVHHPNAIPTSSEPRPAQYGHSWMRSTILARQTSERVVDPRQELSMYLASPLEPEVVDVVRWWGQHSTVYPTLSRMARDYLAIQGSATPSERAFSSGGITDQSRRNRLTTEIFEALQLLKSAYRNGLIQARAEAAARIEPLANVTDNELYPTNA